MGGHIARSAVPVPSHIPAHPPLSHAAHARRKMESCGIGRGHEKGTRAAHCPVAADHWAGESLGHAPHVWATPSTGSRPAPCTRPGCARRMCGGTSRGTSALTRIARRTSSRCAGSIRTLCHPGAHELGWQPACRTAQLAPHMPRNLDGQHAAGATGWLRRGHGRHGKSHDQRRSVSARPLPVARAYRHRCHRQ